MAEFIKSPRVEMVGRTFCHLAGQIFFADRYYKLCQQSPLIKEKSFSCTKQEMFQILNETDRVPQWDARDKSYSFDFIYDGWSVRRGFTFQQPTMEFWFSAQRESEHIGSNYAVIARAATEVIDPAKVPNPPSPRPYCYSHDELRAVLLECFCLSEQLCSLLEKIPKP